MKHCGGCDQAKPLSAFYGDPTKKSGYMSRCKDCCNEARRKRYYARVGHERERSRQYYHSLDDDQRQMRADRARAWQKANPEQARKLARESARRQRASNPEKAREKNRMKAVRDWAKRHGGPDERARMMAEQDGRCYLCRRLFEPGDDIHVDHDHDCCPSGQRTDSCQACRRGLAHAACNQILGLCGEDMDRLRTIIASFEPVQSAAKGRVAALKAAQPQLMPDLDMPLLTPWPQTDGASLF